MARSGLSGILQLVDAAPPRPARLSPSAVAAVWATVASIAAFGLVRGTRPGLDPAESVLWSGVPAAFVAVLHLAISFLSFLRYRAARAPEALLMACAFAPSAVMRAATWFGAGSTEWRSVLVAINVFTAIAFATGALAIARDPDGRPGAVVRRGLLHAAGFWSLIVVAVLAGSGAPSAANFAIYRNVAGAAVVPISLAYAVVLPELSRKRGTALAQVLSLALLSFVSAAWIRWLAPLPLAGAAAWSEMALMFVGQVLVLTALQRDSSEEQRWSRASREALVSAQEKLRSSSARIEESDRRLAETSQELLQSSSRARLLEAAVETTSLGVTIVDRSGRIVFVNRADAALHGYEAAELLGRPASVFSPPAPEDESGDRVLEGPWKRETWNRTRDDRLIPVRLVSDTVRGEDGSPVGRVTVCHDLRPELRARESLMRRDRILHASGLVAERLLDPDSFRPNLDEALRVLGEGTDSRFARFEVVSARPGGAPFPPATWSSGVGSSALAGLPPLAPDLVTVERVTAASGALSSLPSPLARQLAEHGLLSAAFLAVPLEQGAAGVVLLASDDADRQWNDGELEAATIAARVLAAAVRRERARTLLEASRASFERLVNAASDLIQSVAADGTLLYVNDTWTRILGYTSEAAIGRPVWDFLAPESVEGCREHLRLLVLHGRAVRLEATFLAADGRRIEVEGAVSAESEDGRVRATLGIFRDITERRRVERLRREFLSTVSHELRTPLTSMIGSLALVRSLGPRSDEASRDELLEIAERNGDRLLRLINDLLDLQKLEASGLRLNFAGTTVGAIVQSATDGIEGLAQTYGVHVVADVESPGTAVVTDRERVVQVLFNLLSNGIKFSPAGSDVRLVARLDGETLELAVVDRGPGIPAEFRPRLFESFAQADASPSRAAGGTGLGLAIARGLVTSLGGGIAIESAEGEGTTVRVRLPLAGAPQPAGATRLEDTLF